MELTSASPPASINLPAPAFSAPGGGGVQAWDEPRKPAAASGTLHLLQALPARTLVALALTSAILISGVVVLGLHLGGRLLPARGAPGAPADLAAAALGAALPNSITFLALGDWGREGNAAQRLPVPAMAAWAARLKAAGHLNFIFSVGDNFYDGPTTEEGGDLAISQWEKGFRAVYSDPALVNTPWYVIQGNHDYMGNLSYQLGWGTRPGGDPRWIAPALNWTMKFQVGTPLTPSAGCVAIVTLDTCPFIESYLQYNAGSEPRRVLMYRQLLPARNGTEQLKWFYESLRQAARDCPAVAVIGHHPVLGGGRHAMNPVQQDLKHRLHLNDTFAAAGVDLYVNGHDHLLMHNEDSPDGTVYVLSGAGSNIRVGEMEENIRTGYTSSTTKWWAEVGGFTVHSLNATHQQTQYVGAQGAVLHTVFRALRAKNPSFAVTPETPRGSTLNEFKGNWPQHWEQD